MADILPRDLPPAGTVPTDAAMIIDNGVNVERATPAQVLDASAPVATQPEALAGTNNSKRMTALRTSQVIAARTVSFPAGETVSPLPPASARVGGKALGFNSVTGEVEVFDKSALVDNTYTTLEGLKSSSTDANRANLVGAPGIADGSFNWTPGDYSATPPDQLDKNIIKADSTALSVGAWVRQGAASVAYGIGGNVEKKLSEFVSSSDYDYLVVKDGIAAPVGPVMGIDDDWFALTQAIADLGAAGGGELWLTKKDINLSRPLNMETNVVVRGRMQGTTITNKATVASDVTGVRCVISAGDKRYWGLHNVTLIGDRKKVGPVVTGDNYGLYAEFSGYFEVSNVRADYCLEGFKLNQCQTFGVTQAVALRCSAYGFRLYNSCTSFRLKGCSPWACGGGFSITSCIYGSIDTPFVENSDNGNLPGGADTDVFGDSGGDCYNPAFMYEIIGVQGLTITSPGGENNCSQWLYAEGSQVVITGAHLFNTKTFNANWRLIQLRGTARCNVKIINPFGYQDVIQRVTPSGVPIIFVENPEVQKLQITGLWRPASYSANPAAVSVDGVYDETAKPAVHVTQASMVIGSGTPFYSAGSDGANATEWQSGRKVLRLEAGAGAKRFTIPLNVREGWFRLKAAGTASDLADNPRLTFAQYNTSGDLIGDVKTVTGTGASFTIETWVYVAADAGNTLHLDLPANANEKFRFSLIELDHVSGQGL